MNTVLVVDDSPIDQRVAGRLLEKTNQFRVEYAGNGRQALESIQRSTPDLVVTDLQMPEMDGLELVEAVRAEFPLVPVILMTAYGSEDIAVQALVNGAAGYVPKSDLKRDLLHCIDGVLSLARAGRSHQQLRQTVEFSETHFAIPLNPELLAPLIDQIQQMVMAMGVVDETGRIRLAIAVDEVLQFAFYRGNLELSQEQLEAHANHSDSVDGLITDRCQTAPFTERVLRVKLRLSRNECRLAVIHAGPSLDFTALPDPRDPKSMQGQSAGKLLLTRMFMNAVDFSDGRVIEFTKRREEELTSESEPDCE